jgi:hypothetical protein
MWNDLGDFLYGSGIFIHVCVCNEYNGNTPHHPPPSTIPPPPPPPFLISGDQFLLPILYLCCPHPPGTVIINSKLFHIRTIITSPLPRHIDAQVRNNMQYQHLQEFSHNFDSINILLCLSNYLKNRVHICLAVNTVTVESGKNGHSWAS